MSSSTSVLAGSVRLVLSIGLIGLIVAVISVGLRFEHGGGHVLSVQTGSMRPVFRPGDAVIVQRVSPSNLRVGEIVSYHSLADPRLIVSHRIIAVDKRGGLVRVTTKGDAVPLADPTIAAPAVIGQVRAVAPDLGRAIAWFKSPLGLSLAIYLPALLLISLQVRQVIRFLRPTTYRLLPR